MNQLVEIRPAPPPRALGRLAAPTPRRFTASEVSVMERLGFFEDRRVELIEGELFEMPEEGVLHLGLRDRLVAWFYRELIRTARPTVFVTTNGPLRMDEEATPEPDLYLRPGEIDLVELRPAQVLLGVELAFTSHAHDFGRKVPLYARAGLPELWIVDGPKRVTFVHRGPAMDGTWRKVTRVRESDGIRPAALPDLVFRLSDHLPSEQA